MTDGVDVENLLAEIRQVAEQHQAEIERLQTKMRTILPAMIEQAATLPVEDRQWLYRELYWNIPPMVNKTMLLPLTPFQSTNAKGIQDWQGLGPNALHCEKCGRAMRQDWGKHWGVSKPDSVERLCDPCSTAKAEAWIRKHNRETKERLEYLRGLPYREYLRTDHWQKVRADCLKRFRGKCQICNSGTRVHVHHRTYINRGCEKYTDVIVLCSGCHDIFHKEGKLAPATREPAR